MARKVAFVAIACLALLMVPAGSTACTCQISQTLTGLAGDAFVFKLNPDAGPGFKILPGSTMQVTGYFGAGGREDAGGAYYETDLVSFAVGAVAYTSLVNANEAHIEVATNTNLGTQLDAFGPPNLVSGITFTVSFPQEVWYPDRDLYYVLSVPEAVAMDVVLDLSFNKDMAILGQGTGASGVLAASEDFDGAAQVMTTEAGAAASMSVNGQAPAGERGFAVLSPFTSSVAAASYGVDGPGSWDDSVLGAGTGAPPAFVLAGPAGTYRHHVDAMASVGAPVAGYVAVFTSVPMPL